MKTKAGFIVASNKLLKDMKERFGRILDPAHSKFDPVYAVATLLDPRFRLLLKNETLLNPGLEPSAKKEILRLVSAGE
jgi:hypothetical protein